MYKLHKFGMNLEKKKKKKKKKKKLPNLSCLREWSIYLFKMII